MTQTTITIGTRVHRLAHTALRGPRGPAGADGPPGPPGDPASVTPAAVQSALSADQPAGRAALALGTAATTDASDYDPSGSAASSVIAHESAPDPHPQYTTAAEASAAAPVQSVQGQKGAVTLTAADVGAATAAQGTLAEGALQRTGGTLTGPLAVHGDGVTNPVMINDPLDATQILGPAIYSKGELVAQMNGNNGNFNIVDLVKNHAFLVRGQLQLIGVSGTPVLELINVAFSGNPNWGGRAFNIASPGASAVTPYGQITSFRTRMYSWDGSLKATDIFQVTDSLSAAEGDVLMYTYSSTSAGNLIQQHATTGNMKIKGTFAALACPVAALPAASSVPAGSQAFATDGRKAGEGSGAGTGVPVWSDGVKWRTYYDNSEVQA